MDKEEALKIIERVNEQLKEVFKGNNKKKVIAVDIETEEEIEEFDSINEAAKETGTSLKTINKSLAAKTKQEKLEIANRRIKSNHKGIRYYPDRKIGWKLG